MTVTAITYDRKTEGTPAPVAAPAWQEVCRYRELVPERAVAALVAGRQVALVRTHDGVVRAVDNVDPFSGAAVLSRGIVGDRGGRPVLISPMFKQAFSLETGECLDDAGVRLAVHPVRVVEGLVLVGPAGP
jgi:nitrite reductase (NADH) small subunit